MKPFSRPWLRSLTGQVTMILVLVVMCVIGSVTLIVIRKHIESWQYEKYATLPGHAGSARAAAAAGTLTPEHLAHHPKQDRLALYDDWMSAPEPDTHTPAALVNADPALYIARAERSIICGTPDQRTRALKFLTLAGSPQALPMLEKAREWAKTKNNEKLLAQITLCMDTLHRNSVGVPGGN